MADRVYQAGDLVGVGGLAQRGVAEERPDRGQPGVACAGLVAAVGLEVVQEPGDRRRVEVRQPQPGRRGAGLVLQVRQQQPERVAVGGDRGR